VELRRPPNNYLDLEFLGRILDGMEALAAEHCRAVVLASEGRHFCAGADLGSSRRNEGRNHSLTDLVVRLFEQPLPVIAAVQGAAVGAGFGLVMTADFRVASPETRLAANFARLGFHHGWGLSVTLPLITGHQAALDLLMTGRRIDGDEAYRLGVVDRVASAEELRAAAFAFAEEIATAAPLAVLSIRNTLRGALAREVRGALAREHAEQERLTATKDCREGIAAMSERRPPVFRGE
jgi:enoyl-CoA hydratase/carnithine racemase